jgi:hypothetical protein
MEKAYHYKLTVTGGEILARDCGYAGTDNLVDGQVGIYADAEFAINGKTYTGQIVYHLDWLVSKMIERHGADIEERINDDFGVIDCDLWCDSIVSATVDNFYDDGDTLDIGERYRGSWEDIDALN